MKPPKKGKIVTGVTLFNILLIAAVTVIGGLFI
jgi:hypothetical protein